MRRWHENKLQEGLLVEFISEKVIPPLKRIHALVKRGGCAWRIWDATIGLAPLEQIDNLEHQWKVNLGRKRQSHSTYAILSHLICTVEVIKHGERKWKDIRFALKNELLKTEGDNLKLHRKMLKINRWRIPGLRAGRPLA